MDHLHALLAEYSSLPFLTDDIFTQMLKETLHNKLWEKQTPSCGVSHSTEGESGPCCAAEWCHGGGGDGPRVLKREEGRYILCLYLKKVYGKSRG